MTYAYLFAMAAIIYIAVAIHTIIKDHRAINNWLFFVVAMLFFFWSAINAVLFVVTDPEMAAVVKTQTAIAWGLLYSFMLHMVVNFTGHGHIYKKPWAYVVTYLPALGNLLLYLGDPIRPSEMTFTPSGWVNQMPSVHGMLWDAYFITYFIVTLATILWLLAKWQKQTHIKREKKHSKILLATVGLAFLLGSLFEIVLPSYGIIVLPGIAVLMSLIPMFGIWYAVDKFGFLNHDPIRIGYQVMSVMQEGIVIYDMHGKVLFSNQGARSLLGYDQEKDLRDMATIVEDTLLLFRTERAFEIRLKTKEDAFITALCSSLTLKDVINEPVGYIWVFQDVTRMKDVQNELQMMNQTLETLVEERTEALITSNNQLKEEIEEKNRAHKRILQLAQYDHLTNLPNLRQFHQKMNETIKLAKNHDMSFAVMFMDLDHFKNINDTLGHSKGDELLITIAKRLKQVLRKDDFVARVGGDEFILILNEIDPDAGLRPLIDRIQKVFDDPCKLGEHVFHMSASIGVSLYPQHSKQPEKLIQYADIAMYRAKSFGRDTVIIFDEHMSDHVNHVVTLNQEIKQGIQKKEFVVYYQPLVQSQTGEVVGAEALLRWLHPKKGMVLPLDFIPIAEESGLIIDLGNWVIEEVFRQVSEWHHKRHLPVKVSINLSVKQLHCNGLVEHIEACLLKHKLPPQLINFEITESALVNQLSHAKQVLQVLSDKGFGIGIDDFGVEYSSLRYVQQLPINRIKIDKLFIDGIHHNIKDEAIIKAIVTLSRSLGLELVAEGVENEDQLRFLSENACQVIQGFYYSKPVSAPLLETYIETHHLNRSQP